MDVNTLLEIDPKSECEIHFTFTEDWKHCYHQFKQKSNSELDPNKLPLLDEEYLGDTGEPLYNDKNKRFMIQHKRLNMKDFLKLIKQTFTHLNPLLNQFRRK